VRGQMQVILILVICSVTIMTLRPTHTPLHEAFTIHPPSQLKRDTQRAREGGDRIFMVQVRNVSVGLLLLQWLLLLGCVP